MNEENEVIIKEEFDKIEHPLKRVMVRFTMLMVISIISFVLPDLAVAYDKGGFVARFPEVMQLLHASAAIGFIEGIVLMVRVILQPMVDVQRAITEAEKTPMSAAVVYTANQLFLFGRILLLLLICDFI